MERITDAMINRLVGRLQSQGMNVGLDGQYGQFRVTNREGNYNLSPRAPNRQILDWLYAYEVGWTHHEQMIGKHR